MRIHRFVAAWMIFASCAGGAAEGQSPPEGAKTGAALVALRADEEMVLDGRLSEPVWQKASPYRLSLWDGSNPAEAGAVRLAWNDEYLFVAAELEDSDVVAEGKAGDAHLYQTGDVLEVFLKPEGRTWYWEWHATPSGLKALFFHPGAGRVGLPSEIADAIRMGVAPAVEGTLNHWQDRDRKWVVEIAIPIKDLVALGDRFGTGAGWRVMVGRYNYSRYLPARELSSVPVMPGGSFHHPEKFAKLQLER